MNARRYARISLFINPASGNVDPEARATIEGLLRTLTDDLQIHEVKPGSKLVDEARAVVQDGTELVVVAGGDGTIREVASALVQTSVLLGILPLGTYNNLALSLNLPREFAAACAVLQNGEARQIDVGMADERHLFFEAAGVGVDAELFPIGEMVKQGKFRMIFQAIQLALAHRQGRVTLRFDRPVTDAYKKSFRGESPVRHRRRRFRKARSAIRLRCSFLALANGPYYGSNFAICPDAKLDDGLLSVRVFRDFSKRELFTHFWSISRGRYHFHPKVETFEAAAVEVTAPRRLFVHVDGLPIGTTPVRFRVLRNALNVLVAAKKTIGV